MTRRPATLLALLTLIVASLGAMNAAADRAATNKERGVIAKVVELPGKCATVRVSTETQRPKWASVLWKPGPAACEPYARDGVAVVKRRHGRWRFVTAGSDFDCPRLYREVPRRIALDLDLDEWCH